MASQKPMLWSQFFKNFFSGEISFKNITSQPAICSWRRESRIRRGPKFLPSWSRSNEFWIYNNCNVVVSLELLFKVEESRKCVAHLLR
jgi:hypothetical protein